MKNHLIPYFGGMPLDKITKDDVENWFDDIIERDYQNTTINGWFGTLKTMLIEAVEWKLIPNDPAGKMRRLINDRKEIKIITPEEFGKLFTGNWRRVWDNDYITYTANKLAALTGMRASEVLGLKGCFVYGDHTYLCKQFDEHGETGLILPLAMTSPALGLKVTGRGFLCLNPFKLDILTGFFPPGLWYD
jgi:integrase